MLGRAGLIVAAEEVLGTELTGSELPRQGMGSSVVLVSDERGRRLAIKCGEEVGNDLSALQRIAASGLGIPVPAVLAAFTCGGLPAMVMERIDMPLLEDVPDREKKDYIVPMLEMLRRIHGIRQQKSGFVDGRYADLTWKDYLLFKYSGAHPWFDWQRVSERSGVDGRLLRGALADLRRDILAANLPRGDYALLHTDFNQRNLFVDPRSHSIAAVIDWSEAMFGDPLYDFARVRLFIRHFGSGERALERYAAYLDLSGAESERERIYFTCLVVEYIAWYSERQDDFNRGRLRLHQEILRRG